MTAATLAFGSTAGPAAAQELPPDADPGRIRERLQAPPPVRETAPLSLPEAGPEAPPAGAEAMRFHLTGLTLTGNQAIATDQLAPLYAETLGTEVSLADLYGIAAKITAAYRARGFILSQALIPAQRIDGGRATIRVVEGFVDQVTVEGEDPSGRIAAMAGEIAAIRPVTAEVLERYLLLIQDLAGVSARAVLAPSPTVGGAADLTLVVTRDSLQGSLSINNRGSRSLGPYQLTAAMQFNNLSWQDGRAGLTWFTAPAGDELYYAAVSLDQPLGHDGLTLNLSTAYSWTHPGGDLKRFDNDGQSKAIDIGLDFPLVRSRRLSLYVSLGATWRDSRSDFFVSTTPTAIYDDHLRVLRPGLRLQMRDDLGGNNTLAASLSQGFGVFGASGRGDTNLSRANGDPRFTSLSVQAGRTQSLGGNFALVARTSAQYSLDPLLASEEIGFGGTSFGSAFAPSAVTGDSGIGGRLEAAWSWNLPPPAPGFGLFGQSYGFFEGGRIWQRDPPPKERRHDALSAAGIGTRTQLDIGLTGGWELAFPLDHPADTAKPNSARLFFQLGASF